MASATPLVIEEGTSLQALNSFGVPATARYYVRITAKDQLLELAEHPLFQQGPRLVLGGGSNLLFTQDYPGLVVHMAIDYIRLDTMLGTDITVTAGAGTQWHTFVEYCVNKNWGGLENLALIPGSVGAAPVQNIGAYGAELSQYFLLLEALDTHTGQMVELNKEACAFGYRDSLFKGAGKDRYLIGSVTFILNRRPQLNLSYAAVKLELERTPKENYTIKDAFQAVVNIRRSKLPDPRSLGNAGSFFKNPTLPQAEAEALVAANPTLPMFPDVAGRAKVPAAWLIEHAGWKGYRRGHVGTHVNQPLVLVNYGGATGTEVLALAHEIQSSVQQRFGVLLEPEVNIL